MDSNGTDAFSIFIDNAGLDPFSAAAIRPSRIDAIVSGHGRLVDGQTAAQHAEAVTTLRHYLSIRTADGRRLLLAQIPGLMARWAGTRGQIDPRFLTEKADICSATPGFGCLDPYASPVTGQVRGRLCRAMGHCAACPLAVLRGNDPKQVAYVLAYAEAVATSPELPPEKATALLAGYRGFLAAVEPAVLARAAALPRPDVQVSG